jgi:hypothetical protein
MIEAEFLTVDRVDLEEVLTLFEGIEFILSAVGEQPMSFLILSYI